MADALSAAQRPRVWAVSGMAVTLTPVQLRALAELVDMVPVIDRQLEQLRSLELDRAERAARRQAAIDRITFWLLCGWATLLAAEAGLAVARWMVAWA